LNERGIYCILENTPPGGISANVIWGERYEKSKRKKGENGREKGRKGTEKGKKGEIKREIEK
jgi:hypothetical protein